LSRKLQEGHSGGEEALGVNFNETVKTTVWQDTRKKRKMLWQDDPNNVDPLLVGRVRGWGEMGRVIHTREVVLSGSIAGGEEGKIGEPNL